MDRLTNEYEPDYALAPGETIRECLADRGMTQTDLAEHVGVSTTMLNAIMDGNAEISPDVAQGLERALAIPASFWLALERNYRATLARLADSVGAPVGV